METKIREYRLKQKLSQHELAEKSGISRTVISQLENGSREIITSYTMKKIAEALDTKVEEIFLL